MDSLKSNTDEVVGLYFNGSSVKDAINTVKKKKSGMNRLDEKVLCPVCNSSSNVNNVVSSRDVSGLVVYRKFCMRCLIEFDNDRKMYPPLR